MGTQAPSTEEPLIVSPDSHHDDALGWQDSQKARLKRRVPRELRPKAATSWRLHNCLPDCCRSKEWGARASRLTGFQLQDHRHLSPPGPSTLSPAGPDPCHCPHQGWTSFPETTDPILKFTLGWVILEKSSLDSTGSVYFPEGQVHLRDQAADLKLSRKVEIVKFHQALFAWCTSGNTLSRTRLEIS